MSVLFWYSSFDQDKLYKLRMNIGKKKKKKVPWENAEKKSSVIENVRYFKSAKEENQIIFGKNADCILILFKNILWLLTDTIR